jgi:radical SAM protein with 4Fe4S-binding SPASM domain
MTQGARASLGTPVRLAGTLLKDAQARKIYLNNFLKEFSYTNGLLRSFGHPKVYEIETTNHCPYTCNMCPRTHTMTRSLGHMDIGLYRSILDQLQPAWQVDSLGEEPSILLVHYGEPMVYKHFVESVAYAHECGLRVKISTNPSVWTEKRIDEIVDVGVDAMWVMMDGMDDKTSMAIRGRAASFVRGEANVRSLLEKKVRLGLQRPRIHINMVKHPQNAHQWQEFQSYWTGVEGVDSVSLFEFSTFGGDVPALVQLSATLASKDQAQKLSVVRYEQVSKYPCYFPWHSLTVAWDGKVVPCCRDHNSTTVLGDATRQSLEEIWNGQALQDLRKQFVKNRVTAAPCVTCKERSDEIGLPGHFYPFSLINAKRLVAKMSGQTFP